MQDDLRLAKHVSYMHMHNTHPPLESNDDTIETEQLKHCVSLAPTFNPVLPPDVANYLVDTYIMLRERIEETADFQYVSARSLLSIIRLASALALLQFSNAVVMGDVDEARLGDVDGDVSKASLLNSANGKKVYALSHLLNRDPLSDIYETILSMSKSSDGAFEMELKYEDILDKCQGQGIQRGGVESVYCAE
jgi:DNA replication licensing factor MCM7